MPSLFADRLDELEARLNGLSLGDLPLAALQRKLEQDWQPNASTLLGPNSVTQTMLAGLRIDGGLSTLTWPGASQLTTALVVPHSLGQVPSGIAVVTSTHNLMVRYATPTASSITFEGTTRDLSSPPAATARDFYWMAVYIA